MKRSNRLVLLIGVFLAIVAFVGVVLLFNGSGSNPGTATSSIPPTTAAFVKVDDIPIGTVITTDMVETRTIPAGALLPGAIRDIRQITGHTIRIDAPKDVERGDTVEVQVRSGAAHLKLEGRAESAGRRGEAIPVRNLITNKSFSARIVDKDRVLVTARVSPSAKSLKQ